jgi:hypothetical protein
MVCGVADEYCWAANDSASASGSREHVSTCAEELPVEEETVVGAAEDGLWELPDVGVDEELADTEPAFVEDPQADTTTMRAAVVRAT